jgi:protein-L-isoaspartate(D-aspartate) O-methyltransferase
MKAIAGAAFALSLLLLAGCQPSPSTPENLSAQTPTAAPLSTGATWPRADERNQLVDQYIAARGIRSPDVLRAMRTVPRHEFVPPELQSMAYVNRAQLIGYGQTISQPSVVALMTETLDPEPTDRVLEIGTGSGYQAAVLAEIVDQVYTIEIIGALARQADERLARLGYSNVTVRHADGYFGWEEHAPFDAIIVTAAPDHVPQPLLNQLVDGGHLIIPVGPPGAYQTLWLYVREGDEYSAVNLGDVMFVPFTREMRDE